MRIAIKTLVSDTMSKPIPETIGALIIAKTELYSLLRVWEGEAAKGNPVPHDIIALSKYMVVLYDAIIALLKSDAVGNRKNLVRMFTHAYQMSSSMKQMTIAWKRRRRELKQYGQV